MKISFKYISYFFLFVLGLSMTLTSCTDDLNVTPKDDDEFLSETFFIQACSALGRAGQSHGGMVMTIQSSWI